jgi:hypothetical protein
LNRVVYGNERPKVDKTWSPEFVFLLESCCHPDQFRRPTMESVENSLENLLQQFASPGARTVPKKRLSWKILKYSSGETNDETTSGAARGNRDGPTVAATGKTGLSARRTISDSDRKSAWF